PLAGLVLHAMGGAVRSEDAGKIALATLKGIAAGTPGPTGAAVAQALLGAWDEGVAWESFAGASDRALGHLADPLAELARAASSAPATSQDQSKVARGFLEQISRGGGPLEQAAGSALVAAANQGMTWEGYRAALSATFGLLPGSLAPLALACMDAGSTEMEQGKIGYAFARTLGRPDIPAAMLDVSDQGIGWEAYVQVLRQGYRAMPDSLLARVGQAAMEATSGPADNPGKLGRAFMRACRDKSSVLQAYREAANEGLTWENYAAALEAGRQVLLASPDLPAGVRDHLDRFTPPPDAVSRARALEALLEAVGDMEEVLRLVEPPAHGGIEEQEEAVLVGGVRVKKRDEA
ncbi:MAG: hypothetical protein AB1758_36100, partial [Candidatus Eremiobacterota bacterium]